ncbi:uncharacterized protein F4807DRAFT_430681 [Annulohypoxylon truncatum]|uniref:uncharacterized protein n=1 Tax=Annulohypoxylon truncatum TaxID=327061 RepID=UPI002008A42F|nr:uncharacterized protein F4807DRAFT_430681 [Annulohypoxylon truncatum]KAI1208680.1 hypothetical protein F4807DRAFT_430681 [Annulohypoxylon truncatum]
MLPPSTSNTSKHAITKAKAADPKYGQSFDPWNSSATGHQRADNHLGRSTGWRQSRNLKLTSQFKGGPGGGQRVSDTVGAGSKDWDPKLKALVTPELRARAKVSVADMLVKPGTMGRSMSPSTSMIENTSQREEFGNRGDLTTEEKLTTRRKDEDETRQAGKMQSRGAIFDGVVVYINGSTHPLISDHKLKYVLAEHGAKTSINLGRRQVTHVIIGRSAGESGAGGGLAGGKLQKEIQKVGGRGVKFVGAEWVIESIKAGKRLPEAKFSNLKIASKGQQSVYGLYSKPNATAESSSTQ